MKKHFFIFCFLFKPLYSGTCVSKASVFPAKEDDTSSLIQEEVIPTVQAQKYELKDEEDELAVWGDLINRDGKTCFLVTSASFERVSSDNLVSKVIFFLSEIHQFNKVDFPEPICNSMKTMRKMDSTSSCQAISCF